jgi:hypothetical protein
LARVFTSGPKKASKRGARHRKHIAGGQSCLSGLAHIGSDLLPNRAPTGRSRNFANEKAEMLGQWLRVQHVGSSGFDLRLSLLAMIVLVSIWAMLPIGTMTDRFE